MVHFWFLGWSEVTVGTTEAFSAFGFSVGASNRSRQEGMFLRGLCFQALDGADHLKII